MSDKLTCSCANCAQVLEFDPIHSGAVVPCPNCGREVKLHVEAPPTLIAPLAQMDQAKPQEAGKTVRQYVKALRLQSNYKTLRGCINVCFSLCLVLVLASAVGSFIVPDSNILIAGAASVFAVVLIGLLIAFRQAAFLLIDIADTLLHHHSQAHFQQ